MRTGLFKKYTQKLLGYNIKKSEYDSIRLTLSIPIETYRSLITESKNLRKLEQGILKDGTVVVQDNEFGGYTKREIDNDHPEKDLINSILALHYVSGEIDWVDVEDVTK